MKSVLIRLISQIRVRTIDSLTRFIRVLILFCFLLNADLTDLTDFRRQNINFSLLSHIARTLQIKRMLKKLYEICSTPFNQLDPRSNNRQLNSFHPCSNNILLSIERIYRLNGCRKNYMKSVLIRLISQIRVQTIDNLTRFVRVLILFCFLLNADLMD